MEKKLQKTKNLEILEKRISESKCYKNLNLEKQIRNVFLYASPFYLKIKNCIFVI